MSWLALTAGSFLIGGLADRLLGVAFLSPDWWVLGLAALAVWIWFVTTLERIANR